MKIFLSNISNNEIVPDETFPDYGMLQTADSIISIFYVGHPSLLQETFVLYPHLISNLLELHTLIPIIVALSLHNLSNQLFL